MKTGTIKFFNDSKGYGFIKEQGSEREIFVHATGLKEPVKQDDMVHFEEMQGKKGINAINVIKIK